jgi:very-short-patch-repair endonuclease
MVIEIDGGQHNEEEDRAYDQRRSQWLQKAGFRVMRSWIDEVLNQLESVSDAISKALTTRYLPSSSSSSPSTEGDKR